MSKKHLILSQHQCDLLLHFPVHHQPVCHLPIYHLPHHHNTSAMSSEMKENRKNCVRNVNKLPWSEHSRARGLAFRIKMASPQKLLNISQCLSYSEASG